MLESMNNNTFEYQRLSKEEMERRGILGRLIGPCASFDAPTRNGRHYSEKLWENVFNDPIMKERIDNGVCYGELGHPLDREETDMEKIALCLAEVPKKGKDGKLRAVFDILNTPNGKILKSLCDYGSTIGISSRGSGDLETDWDGNESVNPDTYTCEGFDAVLIPAVKEARLQYVNESLNKKRYNKTLRDKLTESINKEDETNQKIMRESLNTLGIKLDESNNYRGYELQTTQSGVFVRDSKGNILREVVSDKEARDYIDSLLDDIDESISIKSSTNSWREWKVGDEVTYITDEFDGHTEEKCVVISVEDDHATISPVDDSSVKYWVDDDTYNFNESLNKQETANINNEVKENFAADDDGALVEELQKALKLNKKLDEKIVALQEKLSAGYAKEVKLNEQIEGYKSRIFKLSKSTKEVRVLNEQLVTANKSKETIDNRCKKLTESINKKNNTINELKESLNKKDEHINSLKVKVNESNKRLKAKTNSLNEITEKYETLNKDLNQLKESYSKKLEQQNALVEKYKNIAMKSVDKYIDTQATRLGVRSSEIKNRLPESYSFKDIDLICEDLQEYKLNMSNLPFSTNSRLREGMSVKVSNVSNKTLVPMEEDIDELTLQLAGLV